MPILTILTTGRDCRSIRIRRELPQRPPAKVVTMNARGILVAVAVFSGPGIGLTFAQLPFTAGAHNCCPQCQQVPTACTCTRTRPVVQTELRTEQVTTFRDVAETRLRPECYVEQRPVTTYRQVTVDEGGYQMVWVPKPVTKQVAQTTMVSEQKSRMVPYQVVRRVPELSTRVVPVQTVRHVTETVPMVTMAPAPIPVVSAPCNTCQPGGLAYGFPVSVPFAPHAALPPRITVLPETHIPSGSAPSASGEWITVPPRTSDSSPPVSVPRRETSAIGIAPSMAPSAALAARSTFLR